MSKKKSSKKKSKLNKISSDINKVQIKISKGPWTKKEDDLLLSWVKKNGEKKWSKCAQLIKTRNGKQCREHWNNCLNSEITKGKWSIEEDLLIMVFFQKYGSWKEILPIFKGRSENSIKNRFYSNLRKIASKRLNMRYNDSIGIEDLKNYLDDCLQNIKTEYFKINNQTQKELDEYINNIELELKKRTKEQKFIDISNIKLNNTKDEKSFPFKNIKDQNDKEIDDDSSLSLSDDKDKKLVINKPINIINNVSIMIKNDPKKENDEKIQAFENDNNINNNNKNNSINCHLSSPNHYIYKNSNNFNTNCFSPFFTQKNSNEISMGKPFFFPQNNTNSALQNSFTVSNGQNYTPYLFNSTSNSQVLSNNQNYNQFLFNSPSGSQALTNNQNYNQFLYNSPSGNQCFFNSNQYYIFHRNPSFDINTYTQNNNNWTRRNSNLELKEI